MSEDDDRFPMDFYVEDGSPRPWKFQPKGYLVVMLADADEGERAEAALVESGFSSHDIKLYPGDRILANYETYVSRRNATDRVAGSVLDDAEGRALYLDYAREGRCAMWVRLADEFQVPKVLRVLTDFTYRYARHYGDKKQTDFHVS